MKSNALIIVRFVLALLTLAALVIQPKIPQKSILIHPLDNTYESIFGEKDRFTWVNQSSGLWRCDYDKFRDPSACGYTLTWDQLSLSGGEIVVTPRAYYPVCESIIPASQSEGGIDLCVIGGEARPVCTSAAEDPDNDGWGWENESSCVVTAPKDNLANLNTLDLSDYDGLRVKIHYEGRARYISVNMGNYTPEIAAENPYLADKSMSALVHTRDLKAGYAVIKFSELNVDEWWIRSNSVPRHLATPAFNRVRSISVTQSDTGIHKTRVERVEVIGERVSRYQLVVALSIFWFAYLLVEALARYFQLRLATTKRAASIEKLASNTAELESEKQKLAELSITDALTGILNRNGIAPFIEALFDNPEDDSCFGVLILDIDHFKQINDTQGHDAGDKIIKEITQVISQHLRDQDLFARWGGEEFIVILPQTERRGTLKVAEKLRSEIHNYPFNRGQNKAATISIGATTAHSKEIFETVFKRADKALYVAKIKRNCIAFEAANKNSFDESHQK